MNLEYKNLLPEDFDLDSRVWIYQSNRRFTMAEALDMELLLNDFTEQWTSHGADVQAYGTLFFGQFVVLLADETKAGVSGCSTDASVRFIKQLGDQFGVDFFNRTNLAFFIKDKIELLPMSQLTYAIANNFITGDTFYFNNLVQTKKELEDQWIIPVKESWLAAKLAVTSASNLPR